MTAPASCTPGLLHSRVHRFPASSARATPPPATSVLSPQSPDSVYAFVADTFRTVLFSTTKFGSHARPLPPAPSAVPCAHSWLSVSRCVPFHCHAPPLPSPNTPPVSSRSQSEIHPRWLTEPSCSRSLQSPTVATASLPASPTLLPGFDVPTPRPLPPCVSPSHPAWPVPVEFGSSPARSSAAHPTMPCPSTFP